MHTFSSFHEWRAAITGPCGLTLTRDYCEGRVRALNNPAESSTKAFTDTYGEPYRQLVVSWFEEAARNANG
jgi:hypothetical protein